MDGSRSTLHQRLRKHAGKSTGSGGNHRGSIFRLLVGEAVIARGDCPPCPSWGVKGDINKAAEALGAEKAALAAAEAPVEAAVSAYLGRDKVRRSGLWNQRHVDDKYMPNFLDVLEAAIETQRRS